MIASIRPSRTDLKQIVSSYGEFLVKQLRLNRKAKNLLFNLQQFWLSLTCIVNSSDKLSMKINEHRHCPPTCKFHYKTIIRTHIRNSSPADSNNKPSRMRTEDRRTGSSTGQRGQCSSSVSKRSEKNLEKIIERIAPFENYTEVSPQKVFNKPTGDIQKELKQTNEHINEMDQIIRQMRQTANLLRGTKQTDTTSNYVNKKIQESPRKRDMSVQCILNDNRSLQNSRKTSRNKVYESSQKMDFKELNYKIYRGSKIYQTILKVQHQQPSLRPLSDVHNHTYVR